MGDDDGMKTMMGYGQWEVRWREDGDGGQDGGRLVMVGCRGEMRDDDGVLCEGNECRAMVLRLGEGEVEKARKGRRREETEGEGDQGERWTCVRWRVR